MIERPSRRKQLSNFSCALVYNLKAIKNLSLYNLPDIKHIGLPIHPNPKHIFYMLDPTPVAKSWIRLCRSK